MLRYRRGAKLYENVIRRKLCKNFPRFSSRKNENWERRGSCHVVFLDVTFPPSCLRRFLSPICWWKTSEKRWWCWNAETHGRGKSEEIPQRFLWEWLQICADGDMNVVRVCNERGMSAYFTSDSKISLRLPERFSDWESSTSYDSLG